MAEIDILEIRKLVSALESSAQGSSVLDLELKCGLGCELSAGSAMAGTGLEAEFAPETVEIILGEMVNPYTRSLDAALPGENIVFSMYSANRKLWVSVHRDADDREFVSWAATEPLSRRAAALRGFASISTEGAEAEPVSMLRAESRIVNGRNGVQDAPSPQIDAEKRDWQVNF